MPQENEKRIGSFVVPFVLFCFFLSGLTGLIYEVLWTRLLIKLIGGAPFAVSIVLTAFMGGLGIGAFIAGRLIDKVEQPGSLLKLYGLLELTIAICAVLIPFAIGVFEPLYSFIYNRLFDHFLLFYFLTFIGCVVILLAPVICMGATLPILCRFCAKSISSIGTNTGIVYGLNTIGAAVGAFICGFWLIGRFGMSKTLSAAVAINCAVGLSCLVLGFRKWFSESFSEIIEEDKIPELSAVESSVLITFMVMIAFGVSGFCSMSYEVIWTRLLGLIIGPTTYSFTIVLVTFITGLALGSMLFGWIADKVRNVLTVFLATQLMAGLTALAVSQLLGNSQLFFVKLIYTYKESFIILYLLKGLVLVAFMMVPTLFIGAAFPLAIKICTRAIREVGNTVGLTYAANTIGAVLGSFSAGFLIIPMLGKEKGISLVVTVQLISVLLLAIVLIHRRQGLIRFAFIIILLIPSFYLVSKYPAWDRLQLARGKYHRVEGFGIDVRKIGWLDSLFKGRQLMAGYEKGKLVFYGDGIGGFTTVLEYFNPLGLNHYSMLNSGKPDASSHADMETQTLLAHFPMLFHPGAKDVMVLGLASGITSGEVLLYPVKQVDTLEISPEVIKACRYFTPWNNNVLSDPRSHIILQDARAHLLLTDKTYDVVISEPSNPWMEGLAMLFTLDFFELVKGRLNEDGIFVQFFHSYQMSWDTFAMVGRTFAKAFPNSLMVVTHPSGFGADFLFVGFKGQYGLELKNADKNIVYTQASKNVRLSNPRLLYKMIMAEDVNSLFGNGVINTDELPLLEFIAPKQMFIWDALAIRNRVAAKNTLRTETVSLVEKMESDVDFQIECARYALSINEPFPNMVDWAAATDAQKEKVAQLFEDYCRHDILDFALLPDKDRMSKRCVAVYIATVEAKLDKCEDKPLCHRFLGDLYAATGEQEKALAHYEQVISLDPNMTEARISLAMLQARNGQVDLAISNLQRAVYIASETPVDVQMELVRLLLTQNRYDEAISVCKKVLTVQLNNTTVLNELGIIYAQMGNFDRAIETFEAALKLDSNLTEAAKNLELCRKATAPK